MNWSQIAAQLLERPINPVYNDEASQLIAGKTVLVTGAGGSIGSEIVRQLYRLNVGRVYYVDKDEYALYQLQQELEGIGLLDDERYILADVSNGQLISQIMATVRPDIVYHAAAHKHLPLLERSPAQAIVNNIKGTEMVVRACVENSVGHCINISTDKAARPISVLGMSKRLAELMALGYGNRGTKIASVRFGNVLGSRGSFLETMHRQLSSAGPVTVTRSDVTRYFMTIPEAAGLVIEASVLAKSGETYVLDMGKPVKILDLIERFVTLQMLASPQIEFTGLRPGEKAHEELYDPTELHSHTANARICQVRADRVNSVARDEVHALYELVQLGSSVSELRSELERLVSGEELHVPALNLEV